MTVEAALVALIREVVREELATMSGSRALSVAEAADRLGIGRSALYDAPARGDIASVRIGRRRLSPAAEIAWLLNAGR